MEVEHYERARFYVHCHGEALTVDLLTDKCNGSCNCFNFLRYIKPELERAKDDKSFVPGDRFRCPHIKAAREWMLQRFLQDLARKFPDNDHPI